MADKRAVAKRKGTNDEGPAKKKTSYHQKFLPHYSKEYPCIIASKVSTNHARCVPCELDFKICYGGLDDVSRHCSSDRHVERSKALKKTVKLSNFFSSSTSEGSSELSTIRAETLFSHFLVEHNIAISAAHAGPLFRAMFPDSKIAKEYSSGRTKTTQIVKACSRGKALELAASMKKGPFVIGTDGSQEGGDKCYPIVVRTVCDGMIKTELLCNPVCSESSTGENIFAILDKELSSLEIPWKNCLALVCDNAYVMTGAHKGVISYVREKHSDVFLAGCVCHLISLALKRGMKASGKFDMDDIMRQLSWYMSKSSGRQQRFQDCQQKCSVPQHQVISHVPTRWLSLGAALSRVLEQWEALKMFFKQECSMKTSDRSSDEASSIKEKLKEFFCRRTAKLYVHFYAAVIEIFDKANKQLQTDHARIHLIKRDLERLFKKLLLSFVKPCALNQGALMEVDFKSSYNIKGDDDLFIGYQTRQHLKEGIQSKGKEIFFKNVKAFFQATCTYMVEKMNPTDQPLWRHAEVADIRLRNQAKSASLDYFIHRFPCLLQDGATQDNLLCEYLEYQSEDSVPPDVMDQECAELQWQMMAKITDHTGSLKFKNLAAVMQGILLIPVSNCACERIFSMVRKNKTDFRGTMTSDTLSALMVLKSGERVPCHQTALSEKLLQTCKSATKKSL